MTCSNSLRDIAEAVENVVIDWRKTLAPGRVALLEAVNLIEAGYGSWCDQVWLVASDQDVARQRLAARNRFTPEEVEQRLASQRPWEERAPASDLVIHNNGTQDDFERTVRNQLNSVKQLWENGELEPSKYHAWWEEFSAERKAEQAE